MRRRIAMAAGTALAVLLAALLAIDVDVRMELSGHLFADVAAAPHAHIALVLGAEVYADGRPSPALQSRLDTGIALLDSGKARLLVLSGGHGTFEVDAMRAYAIAHSVPADRMVDDPEAERTIESCASVRAAHPRERVLVVSQADHVARATFICRRLGVEADGVAAPEFTGDRLVVYLVRERFALVLAWLEATFR